MTKNEDLYYGLDYLPFVISDWLNESASQRALRENYVLVRGEEILGFVSVYFQNERKTAVKFAFRIAKELRGGGYGKLTTSLLNRRLTTSYPQLGSIISAMADVEEDQIKSSKFGELLTVKSISVYKFRRDQVISALSKKDLGLTELSKNQFAGLLRDPRICHLLDNNILTLNWVPVRAQTEEDIEFAVRKRQTVMVEEGGQQASLREML